MMTCSTRSRLPRLAWLVTVLACSTAGCKSREPERAPQPPPVPSAVGTAQVEPPLISSVSKVLAELPAPRKGAVATAGAPAWDPAGTVRFAERGGAVAYIVEEGKKYRVVFNGSPGKVYDGVEDLRLSPDGRRWAHAAFQGNKWCVVVDGVEGPAFDEAGGAVFSPDGRHVLYQAKSGEARILVLDGKEVARGAEAYSQYEVGAGPTVVFVKDADAQGWARLFVTDATGAVRVELGERVAAVVLNRDRTRLAAVAGKDGAMRVVSFPLDRPQDLSGGPVYAEISAVTFAPAGASLGYLAARGDRQFAVLDGREAVLPAGQIVGGGGHGDPALHVRPDGRSLAVFLAAGDTVALHQPFAGVPPEQGYEEIEGFTYGADGAVHAYAARTGDRWHLVVNGKAGPGYDRVVDPAFSPDGKRFAYRARAAGKRFVVVGDTAGSTTRQLPAYEQVFPALFTADGRSVAYGVKDGRRLAWKVEPL